MRKRISPTTIVACLALFFSLGGASLAASRYLITSTSQIKPSVRHALRGQVGPQGAPGLVGPQGIQGPQGVPGTPAPKIGAIFAADEQPVTIAPGSTGYASATCPVGPAPFYYWTVAGGYTSDLAGNPPAGLEVFHNMASTVATWLVGAFNPTSQPITLQAWATCIVSSAPPPYASQSPSSQRP